MIADDVGIGKTIEAGLILRELLDRREVDRFAILCPPHLVEQWTTELKGKFDLDAVAVTASSAARLERSLAASQSLFEAHSYTVVSLDHIKAEKRRDSFARACPQFVIVDEAHACVGSHMGRQQRFELLKRLSEDDQRHLLLLTATPHSGDEDAFDRLLGRVNHEFSSGSLETDAGRRRLARHFLQRRPRLLPGSGGRRRRRPTQPAARFLEHFSPHALRRVIALGRIKRIADAALLHALVQQAERLTHAPDPKLDAIVAVLRPLIAEGAKPIVFCRFIATAGHVAAGLRKAFPKIRVEAITGVLTPEDRRTRVESMADSEPRILVATDCLSEGINLQHLFDVVVHYDLSWNPTRHQQREGRVDRFGQPAKLVRSVLLFSPDSAIDGAVLDVILRKAEAIRLATGVTVPLPEERSAVAGALMNAVLLRKGRTQQLMLDFGIDLSVASAQMEARWRDAEEGEQRSRARFAQNTIRPEEVAPEWQRWRSLLGGPRRS
jgi:superfamily II DNA or RNA helicase